MHMCRLFFLTLLFTLPVVFLSGCGTTNKYNKLVIELESSPEKPLPVIIVSEPIDISGLTSEAARDKFAQRTKILGTLSTYVEGSKIFSQVDLANPISEPDFLLNDELRESVVLVVREPEILIKVDPLGSFGSNFALGFVTLGAAPKAQYTFNGTANFTLTAYRPGNASRLLEGKVKLKKKLYYAQGQLELNPPEFYDELLHSGIRVVVADMVQDPLFYTGAHKGSNGSESE